MALIDNEKSFCAELDFGSVMFFEINGVARFDFRYFIADGDHIEQNGFNIRNDEVALFCLNSLNDNSLSYGCEHDISLVRWLNSKLNAQLTIKSTRMMIPSSEGNFDFYPVRLRYDLIVSNGDAFVAVRLPGFIISRYHGATGVHDVLE